jgi:hypothetical protein
VVLEGIPSLHFLSLSFYSPFFPSLPFSRTQLFYSVGGMVGAIKKRDCDIIGLARPLAIEPQFGKCIFDTPTFSRCFFPLCHFL